MLAQILLAVAFGFFVARSVQEGGPFPHLGWLGLAVWVLVALIGAFGH